MPNSQSLLCRARVSRLLPLVLVAMLSGQATAAPSGGPYGPVPQRYEVPTQGRVFHVAPDGDAKASGQSLDRPTRLESAIAQVRTGDTIVLRGGIYRTGSLQLNQGITLQPYLDETPVLKGTRVATEWEPLRDNVWRTKWETLFPAQPLAWWRREREGMRTPLHRFNNDMVFVDGKLLRSVGWESELDESSYYIDYEAGYVYIGQDPKGRVVEITAHDIALHRPSREVHGKASDGKGPTIRGLTFTQYAYRAIDIEDRKPSTGPNEEPTDDPVGISDPSEHGKQVTGTVLENVTISHTSRVAGYFRGDGLVIRNSLISDTGTEGIYVIGSSDVLLERNIVRRNNSEQLTGYYPGAVKIFNQSYRVTVRDNLIIEQPHSNGVWFDVGNVDGVVVDNYFEGNQIGLFFEISKGVIAAGNVFVDNDQGIRILNSSNARVYQNTFLNSPAVFDRDGRSAHGDHFAWHPATGPDVHERVGHVFKGNLVVADRPLEAPLLQFVQAPALCGKLKGSMAAQVDGNAYVRADASTPLASFGPTTGKDCKAGFETVAQFARATGFDRNALDRRGQAGSIFRSVEMKRYDLAAPPAGLQAQAVDPEALKVLGWDAQPQWPGAYPASR